MIDIFTTVFCWIAILLTIVLGMCGCIILVLFTIEEIKEIKDIDKK